MIDQSGTVDMKHMFTCRPRQSWSTSVKAELTALAKYEPFLHTVLWWLQVDLQHLKSAISTTGVLFSFWPIWYNRIALLSVPARHWDQSKHKCVLIWWWVWKKQWLHIKNEWEIRRDKAYGTWARLELEMDFLLNTFTFWSFAFTLLDYYNHRNIIQKLSNPHLLILITPCFPKIIVSGT